MSTTESSVAKGETAYTLTVTKDGYLPGTITGVYVTYTETEEQEVTRANALLHGLQYDYQDVLKAYAATLSNATATGSTATTTTTATEDTTATTTVQTGSNADRVFKDVSEAISALKNMYKTGSYTEYFSTFGTSSALIPLDATLKGSLMLNTTSNEGTTWAETTYKPTSKPTVHASYKTTAGADYTWAAQADANGIFEFKEKLPSGVELTISVDSFQETIESNDYWFSSESMIVLVDNSGAETTSGVKKVTLGSKDVNSETYRFLLFAQNDKLWVTKTNTETTASGVLLTKNDPLTFTFNKAVKKVDIDTTSNTKTTGFKNLSKDSYDAKISEDGKTVTFTPKIGYWELDTTATSTQVVLTAEAVDGTTKLEKSVFPVYFDNKVWVSVKDLSYADYNDYRKLSDPIVLVFSKPMNEKIAVNLSNNKTAYTEKWNEADAEKGILANTELTLTPDAKVGYWDIGSNTSVDITVTPTFANSKESYIDTFGYWKVGAATDGSKLTVYFDNYNDVTLEKVSDSEFTVTFAKALKALTDAELDKNVKVYRLADFEKVYTFTNATAIADRKVSLNADGTVLTIKAQNGDFEKYGYYAIDFGKDVFVAKTGESILRKASTVDTVEVDASDKREATSVLAKTPFVTTFTLGSEFKYVSVAIVDSNDEDLAKAKASRAVYEENDKYVKLEFNKDVKSSDITIYGKIVSGALSNNDDDKTKPTNWINGKYVFLSLKGAKDDWKVILKGTVKSTSGNDWELGNAALGFDTLYVVSEKFFKMESSSLYAQDPSIAGGKNDVTTRKIDPKEVKSFTFTFDQDVSGATWTAELYDEDNVGVKDKAKTLYGVTVKAELDTVTVTVDPAKKQLDYGKKYYLSLKATNGIAGEEAFVYYDSNATARSDKYYKVVGKDSNNATVNLASKIIVEKQHGTEKHYYIEIETEKEDYKRETLYVLAAHKGIDVTTTSKTTSTEDFAKSINSPIVLEFNQDITDIVDPAAVYLVKGSEKYSVTQNQVDAEGENNWLTTKVVDPTLTYTATVKVDKTTLTITPTYAYGSGDAVYPVVFDKDGKRVPLRLVGDDVSKNEAKFASTAAYKAATLTLKNDKEAADEATNKLLDTEFKGFKPAVFNASQVGNKTPLFFSFDPRHSANSAKANFGKYTLYRKITGFVAAKAVWEKVGTYEIVENGTSTLKAVDPSKVDTKLNEAKDKTEKEDSVKPATIDLLTVGGYQACIETTTEKDEFNFSTTSTYKIVCEIDSDVIYSEAVTVEDKKLNSKLTMADDSAIVGKETTDLLTGAETTKITIATASDAEVPLVAKDLKLSAECYMKSVTVTLTKGTAVAVTPANKDKRIGNGGAKYKVTLDDNHNVATINITDKDGAEPVVAKGDTITIVGFDAKGIKRTYILTFAKELPTN